MRTAVELGIRRVINTGPHFTVAGPTYEQLDFGISPDIPPHPGTGLYPLTKSLGQEICRIFTEHHDVYVIELLFYILRDLGELKPGAWWHSVHRGLGRCRRGLSSGTGDRSGEVADQVRSVLHFGRHAAGQVLNRKAKDILVSRRDHDVSVLWKRAAREGKS